MSSESSVAGPEAATREHFTFFYATDSPFSQFHPCTFMGVTLFSDTASELTFNCAEQWMMMNKAELFKDFEIAEKIRKSGYSPQYVKSLGRQVKNFDEIIWKEHNRRIIYEGNKLKFTQNPILLDQLMGTEGTTLVEASPNDSIYGIGLRASDPRAFSRKTWRGTNLLGEVLTTLREELIASSS